MSKNFRTIKILFLAIFILQSISGFSQNMDKIPVLKDRLEKETVDSTRFTILDSLALLYSRIDFDSAEYYNNLNLKLGRNQDSDYYLGRAGFRKGANHVFSNQLQLAVKYLHEALPYVIRASDKWLEAKIYYYLGNLAYTMSQHAEAITQYQRSMVLSDSLGWTKGRVDNRHNLGGVYFDLESYDQADIYLSEAKNLVEELGDTNRIPMVLAVMTEVALILQNYDRVDSIALMIIGMSDTLAAADYHVPGSYMKLGETKTIAGDYQEANKYYFQALDRLNDPELFFPGPRDMRKSQAYCLIGQTYYELGKTGLAKSYLITADSMAANLNYYAILRDANELLWKIEQEQGNYQSALAYFSSYKTYSDSILNAETLNKTLRARVEFELEERKKEEENRLAMVELQAEQRAQTYYWIIAIVILGLIVLGLLLLLQRSKTKREILTKEKIQSDLDAKHRELASYVLQLMRKNELLLDVSERLRKVRKSNKQEQQKELLSVHNSISLNSKDIGWDEFELRFKEVHPSFYNNLSRLYPDLTSNENRLCAFLKLNMSSKEISSLTFQSEHSIYQARSRLKKKLGLEEGQSLTRFVSTL